MQTIKIKPKLKFILIASAVGTLYVLTLFCSSTYIFTKLPFKILIAMLMIVISIRKKNIAAVLKATIIFMLYSMVLCGLIITIQYNEPNINYYDMSFTSFSPNSIILSLMIGYLFINRIVIFVKDRRNIQNFKYKVQISVDNKCKELDAFLDTGNELREPITNLPVIIVEKSLLSDIELERKDKYFIPYKVIGGMTGKIEAFKPDGIKIFYDNNRYELKEALIAISEQKLSDINEFNALLSRGII
jgi:Sporulation factor SpoIIGA.